MRICISLAATVLALLASSCASTTQADPAGYSPSNQRLAILVGQKTLEEDDFAPLDELPSLTVEYSNGGSPDSIGYEFGVSGSSDSEGPVDLTALEIYGGIRKEFGDDVVRPFLGLGVSAQKLTLEAFGGEVDDTVVGGYVHLGINFQVAEGFSLILDGRALFADKYDFDGAESESQTLGIGVGVGISL